MIDTHCHLVDPQFNHDLDAVCKRAQDAGIGAIVNAGYDLTTSQLAWAMHESTPWLLPAVGIHPNEAAAQSILQMVMIDSLAAKAGVVAIGETGLDYYRDRSSREAQKELFKLHIKSAYTRSLPLLVHTRNSIDDAITILESGPELKGVFHCYSGTEEQAKRIIELGFYLGFGGVLTFSKRARRVFKTLPKERLLLETDAPFLAPATYRGQRNEPAYLQETLRTAAEISDRSQEYIEQITDENAKTLFSIQ